MTPEQIVTISAVCIAGGITMLILLAHRKRRNLRIAEAGLPLKDDLREMKMRIEELSESLAQAKATIADLREMLNRSGTPAPRRSRNTDPDGRDEIVRLCETGMDVLEIARRLDMPAGEVELVLNLHRRGKTGAATRK